MRRNVKEKYRRKQKRKSPRNDQETATGRWSESGPKSKVAGDLGLWSPATMAQGHAWSPATLEIRVSGFPPKVSFFRSFSCFAMFGPCDFLKIWFLRHDIRRSSSTSRIRYQNHLIIIGHSETANRPTKKAHFLHDRSRNRRDRCCRPISGNQCLNFHRHPTSRNVRIHRWSSQEEFQKTRRGPRLFKRLGDQLIMLIDPLMTSYCGH